jgi:alkaline phosphatase D
MGRKSMWTRRRFLNVAGMGAAGAIVPPWFTPARAAEAISLQDAGLSLPCCAGDAGADSAVVWLRTIKASEVAVEYGTDASLSSALRTAPIRTSADHDHTGKVLLAGLQPASTYYYRAVVAQHKPGPMARFVTAPGADQAASLRFAFGGDTRQNYRPFHIMDAIRAKQPNFFLHLGDTIYADRDGAAHQLKQFWQKYATHRDDEPTQRLLAETSWYVTWDDHEVRDNYRAADPLAPVGRRAFFDYWPIRKELADAERVYRSARWGSLAELFILDTRQYRDESNGTILGPAQLSWFVDALAKSTARFKFVCTSVPFTSPATDKWGGYPADRKAILASIKERNVTGVIFLAADVHYAAVVRVAGNTALREVITGPLATTMGKATGNAKRFIYFNNEHLNYGLVSVHADGEKSYVEIEILTDKNQLLHKVRIPEI